MSTRAQRSVVYGTSKGPGIFRERAGGKNCPATLGGADPMKRGGVGPGGGALGKKKKKQEVGDIGFGNTVLLF